MTPTPQQVDFFSEIENGVRHVALLARAGCGKTTTIMGAVNRIAKTKPNAETVICAYNKAIADELKEKLKESEIDWRKAQASTLHGLGYGLLKRSFSSEVDEKKTRKLMESLIQNPNFVGQYPEAEEVFNLHSSSVATLVSYAKSAGVGYFNDMQIADHGIWNGLAEHYDMELPEDPTTCRDIVTCAQVVYKQGLRDVKTIDYDDMILLPLIHKMRVSFPKDFLFLDEAQDLSPARQALARMFVKPRTGRMIIVGDDKQAIYGFSGADANAMWNLIESLDAKVLPLSVTWRCAKAVVERAQTLVPDIQASPTAKDGTLSEVVELPDDLSGTDAILCRNTAPLIKTAYALMRKRIACKVEGRAIGEGLEKLCNRWKVKNINALADKLAIYKTREVTKLLKADKPNKAEELTDRVDALLIICDACQANNEQRVENVIASIRTMFADGAKGVLTLCTYHRSKGREWNRVILLHHSKYCPSKAARMAWQIDQENNLAYVAYTRAKDTLLFLEAEAA